MTSPLPDNPGAVVAAATTPEVTRPAAPAGALNRVMRDFSYYLGASVLSQAVNMIRAFAIPFLLAPAQLGLWNLMNVVISYAPNAHLGVLHGMNKALPRLRANGEHQEADALRDSALWVTLLLGVIAAAITLMIALAKPTVAMPLAITSAIVLVQLPYTFLFCLLRADSRFQTVSAGLVLMAVLSTVLVLGVAAVARERLTGALMGLAVAWIMTTVFLFVSAGYKYRIRIDWALIRSALVIGLPIAVITVADTLFMSIDRWVIMGSLGEQALGYYALGAMASGVLAFVPNSLFQVLFPELIARYARAGHAAALAEPFRAALIGISTVMLAIVLVAAPTITGFIELWLPLYVSAIPSLQILVSGTFFLAIAWISNGFIVTVDKGNAIVVLQVIAAAAGLAVDALLLRAGAGIVGVAIGTVVSYATLGFGAAIIAARAVMPNPAAIAGLLASLTAPFLVGAGLLWALYGRGGRSGMAVVQHASITIIVVVTASALVVWRMPGTVALMRTFVQALIARRQPPAAP